MTYTLKMMRRRRRNCNNVLEMYHILLDSYNKIKIQVFQTTLTTQLVTTVTANLGALQIAFSRCIEHFMNIKRFLWRALFTPCITNCVKSFAVCSHTLLTVLCVFHTFCTDRREQNKFISLHINSSHY